MISGRIDIRAEALEPIHHGAGTSGNVSILRKQEIVNDEGRRVSVPYISGNSIRHMIRAGCAVHALETMGVEVGSLNKPVVDLLFSGGALTKTGGNQQIGRARELARLFPALGLLGYSAGNTLTESRLTTHHLHLVCQENAGRAPADAHPAMLERRAGFFLSEEFGTRHDAARSASARGYLTDGDAEARDEALAKRGEAKSAQEARGDSTQMIYAFQTVRAGSRWWGAMRFSQCSDTEMMALRAGLSRACEGTHPAGLLFTLGAKGAQGFGKMAMEFRGYRLGIAEPAYSPAPGIVQWGDDPTWAAYVAHLRTERETILAALKEASA